MSKELLKIKKVLKEESDGKAKESWRKFVPSSEKVYGVYLSEVNKLALKYKDNRFGLVEELWKSGSVEEKLLASKILGEVCKKDPQKTLKLIRKFSKDISNWAVCDTLATQGIRGIVRTKQKEIFEISKKLIKSKNLWQRRFAIVLLINFTKDKSLKKEIKRIVRHIENDKEHYVKKAVEWIKRKLE